MDFNFSDDQEMLRDSVRKWVDKGYDFERRKSIVKAGGFSREAWDELAELGLAGLYIPEDESCLCRFEASDAEDVRLVNELARVPFARITAATELTVHDTGGDSL